MKFEETLRYTQANGIQKPTKWFPPLAEYGEARFLEQNILETGWTMLGLGVKTKVRNVGEVKYELNAFSRQASVRQITGATALDAADVERVLSELGEKGLAVEQDGPFR